MLPLILVELTCLPILVATCQWNHSCGYRIRISTKVFTMEYRSDNSLIYKKKARFIYVTLGVRMTHAPTYKNVSKATYNAMQLPVLFGERPDDSCFGIISSGDWGYRFSWDDGATSPFLTDVYDSVYSIGYEQNVALVDFTTYRVLTELWLTFIYCDTLLFYDVIIIATEAEIILLDKRAYTEIARQMLTEYFSYADIDGDEAVITCANGDEFAISRYGYGISQR